MNQLRLEICVDTLLGAKQAAASGAHRLELCSSLDLEGLSPPIELFQAVKAEVHIPVMVMVRPRAGNFIYQGEDFERMKSEIKTWLPFPIKGFVFGNLNNQQMPDLDQCRQLMDLADGRPCTFHRAFDLCIEQAVAMEQIIRLGFSRILTSGDQPTARQGKKRLKQLIELAGDRIQILPGGKIRPHNAFALQQYLDCDELHSSATEGWSN